MNELKNFRIVGQEECCTIFGGSDDSIGNAVRNIGMAIGLLAKFLYKLKYGKQARNIVMDADHLNNWE